MLYIDKGNSKPKDKLIQDVASFVQENKRRVVIIYLVAFLCKKRKNIIRVDFLKVMVSAWANLILN